MKTTRFITVTALFSALLIGVQFALSTIPGIELVTAFFLAFCFCEGVKEGVFVGVCFSLLRCLLFGFYPTVVILYLIYYPLFGAVFGFIGNKFSHKTGVVALFAVTVSAVILTAVFTLIDDVVTPVFFGFGKDAAVAYLQSSLPFMLTQCACAAVSVAFLFVPLVKAFSSAKSR